MAKLWKSVDLTPEMIRNWFNYLRPRVGYSPYHYGAFITDWNGERIGPWYSVRDWRDKGSATLVENNQVIVKVPILICILRDVPRILEFVLFQKPPSVPLDDLPSSHRGFARRGGGDVQLFRYRNRAHPKFSRPPIT